MKTFDGQLKIFESFLYNEAFSTGYFKPTLARLPIQDKLAVIKQQIERVKKAMDITPYRLKKLDLRDKLRRLINAEKNAEAMLARGIPIKKKVAGWQTTY